MEQTNEDTMFINPQIKAEETDFAPIAAWLLNQQCPDRESERAAIVQAMEYFQGKLQEAFEEGRRYERANHSGLTPC